VFWTERAGAGHVDDLEPGAIDEHHAIVKAARLSTILGAERVARARREVRVESGRK
jgi:hypothetical protein